MKNRIIKLIISICVISCLMVGFCTSFASAAEPPWLLRIKAAVAAAMLAGNLVITPIDVALSEPIASGIDPYGELPWVETLPEYLDRSVIRVYPDVVTIDGVPYSDVWIGPDAADSLRLKGLDFATAYNILNNQSQAVTYASGAGYVDGMPLYIVDGYIRTPSTTLTQGGYTFSFGNASVRLYSGNFPDYAVTFSNGNASGGRAGTYPINFAIGNHYNGYFPATFSGMLINSQGGINFGSAANCTDISQNSPFSFDYTSGIIDAPIAEDDGLLMRIPSSYSDPDNPQYNFDIHDLININPTITQPGGHEINIDPYLNPDFQTDIDLGNGVGDLIRIIIQLLDLLDNIDIEYAPEPESPEPGPVDPDPAIPDTPVGEQDGTWLDELLRWIKNAIDTISQTIIDAKDDIQNEIQDLSQTISELPEQILEDIETGPSKVFRKAIDILKSLFMPLLLPIKAMMGLWHYVVEWIGSVTLPFTWIFGIMSGASYNMVLPVYAALAGSICIAIYKALGR